MRIIRPTTITDAMLTSSTVAETDHAAYNGATTYALGDRVIVTTADHCMVVENIRHKPLESV